MHSLTRRDFLQTAGVSLALGAVSPARLLPSPASASTFALRFDGGAIVSLKRVADAFDTEYVLAARRLGDAIIAYRQGSGPWKTLETATATARTLSPVADDAHSAATYRPTDGTFEVRIGFAVEDTVVRWTLEVENLADMPRSAI